MDDNELIKNNENYYTNSLNISEKNLDKLRKKLKKIEPRSERGVETLFRLLSKNQYTLNTIIDRKSNILITINAIMISIIVSIVLNQISTDPHLIYAILLMLITNLASITYAVFATRPELTHGNEKTRNIMFYGNFSNMKEEEYVSEITNIMNQGDVLYETIAKDTYYLGLELEKKFALLRKSFNIFLVGIILSVITFVICHLLFEGMI